MTQPRAVGADWSCWSSGSNGTIALSCRVGVWLCCAELGLDSVMLPQPCRGPECCLIFRCTFLPCGSSARSPWCSSRRQAATHPGSSQATGPCFACCFAFSPVDFVSSSLSAMHRFICFGLRALLGNHPLRAALGGGTSPWGHRGDRGLKRCHPVPPCTVTRRGGCWVTSDSHLLAEPKPAPC